MKIEEIPLNYFKALNIFVILLILGFGYLFVIGPRWDVIKKDKTLSLQSQKEYLESRKKYLDDLKKIKDNYEKLNKEEIEKLSLILPREKDLPVLFINLSKLAKDNNMVLSSLNISESQKERDLNTLILSIKVDGGDYATFKKFLDSLERNLRIFDVLSVSFSPRELSYRLNLKTYYLP